MEREERFTIIGTVRTNAGTPVDGAWVRLDPDGEQTRTAYGGRFLFSRVMREREYTLRAQAVGLGAVDRDVTVPSPTGEYDLIFS